MSRLIFQRGMARRVPGDWQQLPGGKPRARPEIKPLPENPRQERRRNNRLRFWHVPDGTIWGEVGRSHNLRLIDWGWEPAFQPRPLPRQPFPGSGPCDKGGCGCEGGGEGGGGGGGCGG